MSDSTGGTDEATVGPAKEGTDEPSKTDEPEILRLVRSLADPSQRRTHIRGIVSFLLFCALVPILLLLPGLVGKMLAIGVGAALAEDVSMLGQALIIGPGIMCAIFGGAYLTQLLLWLVQRGLTALFLALPDGARRMLRSAGRLGKWFVIVGAIGGIMYSCGQDGYRSALKSGPPPVLAADQQTIAATRDAAAKQVQAIKQFSATAGTLLKDLDNTAAKVAETKREIAQTMVLFDRQLEATQAAQSNLSQLQEKQRQIQGRAEELERILQGKRPITLEDMERSGRESLSQGIWTGLLFGVLSSLVATYLYPRLGSLLLGIVRWKKEED